MLNLDIKLGGSQVDGVDNQRVHPARTAQAQSEAGLGKYQLIKILALLPGQSQSTVTFLTEPGSGIAITKIKDQRLEGGIELEQTRTGARPVQLGALPRNRLGEVDQGCNARQSLHALRRVGLGASRVSVVVDGQRLFNIRRTYLHQGISRQQQAIL